MFSYTERLNNLRSALMNYQSSLRFCFRSLWRHPAHSLVESAAESLWVTGSRLNDLGAQLVSIPHLGRVHAHAHVHTHACSHAHAHTHPPALTPHAGPRSHSHRPPLSLRLHPGHAHSCPRAFAPLPPSWFRISKAQRTSRRGEVLLRGCSLV